MNAGKEDLGEYQMVRLKVPKNRTHGQRLHVNGQIVTHKEAVTNAWAHHFKNLCSSKASALSNIESLIPSYRFASFQNDFVFDYDITTEEIKGIIKMLRNGKACGLDST